jgi:hypothetical protein
MIQLYPLNSKGAPTHEALIPPKSVPQSRYYTRLVVIGAIMALICFLLVQGVLGFNGFYMFVIGGDFLQPWLIVLVILSFIYWRTISRAQTNLGNQRNEQSIDTFMLTVSTGQPIIGDEFTIRHTLTFKQSAQIHKIRLRLQARIFDGEDEYGPSYHTEDVLSHEALGGYGNAYTPLSDEFTWNVPDKPPYLSAQWSIEVAIHPTYGAQITAKYPITLIHPRSSLRNV